MSANQSPYVTLISNDGFEFIVSREAACVAGTIKKMIDPQSKSEFPPYPGHRSVETREIAVQKVR